MKKSHSELLQGLVSAGLRERYGKKLEPKQINENTKICSIAPVRMLLEMKQIEEAGFVDYYLMAFWIFKYSMQDINFWARGAMPSSIVCYCLGLTEIDPIKYGLHSARFVNDELPKFQFDIDASRFDEFMKKAEEILAENTEDFDIPAIRECLFRDLKPSSYLSKKKERPLPDDLEDEFARYALSFPDTINLYESYSLRKEAHEKWKHTGINQLDKILASTYGILAYQEQMIDILQELFHVSTIEANGIRLAIQRGESELLEASKSELFSNLKDLTAKEAERVWNMLVSNRKAFMKAHAVSRVLINYKYEIQ